MANQARQHRIHGGALQSIDDCKEGRDEIDDECLWATHERISKKDEDQYKSPGFGCPDHLLAIDRIGEDSAVQSKDDERNDFNDA
jgi:hypothetical protein